MNRRSTHRWRLRRVSREDKGIAVVAVVLLTAVLTGLVATSTVITVNNLDNSRRDRQSLAASSTSEAGLAQAVQFLWGTRLGRLTCVEPAAGAAPGVTCQGTGPSWISARTPQEVKIDGATGTSGVVSNCFRVWIGTVKPYKPSCAEFHAIPPGRCFGIYTGACDRTCRKWADREAAPRRRSGDTILIPGWHLLRDAEWQRQCRPTPREHLH